jgi:hypothetical protein
MKLYSPKQFILDNHTIPNLPPEFTLDQSNFVDDYGRTVKRTQLKYNGTLVVDFARHNVDRWTIFNLNETMILSLGTDLTSRMTSRHMATAFLDDLYYTYNSPNIKFKDGKLFAKTYQAIIYRLNMGPEYHNTKLTKRILEAIDKEITNIISRGFPSLEVNSFEFNKLKQGHLNGNLRPYFTFHSFTGKPVTQYSEYITSLGPIRVGNQEVPEAYGYTQVSENWRTYWIKEGEFLHDGTIVNLADGATECPICGTTVPNGYMVHDEEDGNMCKKCHEQNYEIMNYTTRVPSILKFKATKVTPETLYLGCELEFETTDRNAARMKVGKALRGHAIMKSDGSIRNGFEVVTCPATLDIHLDIFKKFFDRNITELTKADNVGMHVHVSRKPLSVLTVGKITEFMNRADNVKFITHIAGRAPNNYCRQNSDRTISYPWTNQGNSERYNALNLNNKDTIEFRIFSTPLTYEEFAHKVQFCQALVDYCKPAASGLPLKQHTSHHSFINWALGNYKFYPDLAAKIKSFSSVSA